MFEVDTELLTPEERARVEKVQAEHPHWNPDGYVNFWDAGTIQLDGDFDLEEIETLVKIMKAVRGQGDLKET